MVEYVVGTLTDRIKLSGTINKEASLSGKICQTENLTGRINIFNSADKYMGVYEITPLVDSQVIPTANKFMSQDVTVKEIPRYNVSNEKGGFTFIIGGIE